MGSLLDDQPGARSPGPAPRRPPARESRTATPKRHLPAPRRWRALIVLPGYAGPIAGVLLLAKVHARVVGHYDFTASSRLPWTLAYLVLLWTTIYAAGLPDGLGRRSAVGASAAAVAVPALAISALQLGLGSELLPRFVVFGTSAVLVPYLWIWSLITQRRPAEADQYGVVALLDNAEACALANELARSGVTSVWVHSIIRSEHRDDAQSLVEAVKDTGASVVVLNRAALLDPAIVARAAELHRTGVRIRELSRFYEDTFGKVPLTELAQSSLLFDVPELHSRGYHRAKRLVDVVVGLGALPGLAVLAPLIMLANVFGNRGPLFFRQTRVGKNGVPFELLKFRSMRLGSSAGDWTLDGDSRLTTVGRWMRRLHLDEAPQLLNVLRGELAIVGPRPEQPRYVDQLEATVPFYDARHILQPGLTGWAQVNYGYGASKQDAIEKLQYDFFYMRHQSIRLDMRILARTLRSVAQATGR